MPNDEIRTEPFINIISSFVHQSCFCFSIMSSSSSGSDMSSAESSSEEELKKIKRLLGVPSIFQKNPPQALVVLQDIMAPIAKRGNVKVTETVQKGKSSSSSTHVQDVMATANSLGVKKGGGDNLEGGKKSEGDKLESGKKSEGDNLEGEKKKIQWPDDWSDLSSEHSDYVPDACEELSSCESEKENDGENQQSAVKDKPNTSKAARKKPTKNVPQKDPAKTSAVAAVLKTKIIANVSRAY